nr:hypothetical protein [Kofleriaceae bacterium]
MNCHLGLSGQHTHPNYKLRCIDCHGGNDQVDVPPDATVVSSGSATDTGKFRDPALLKQAHVQYKNPVLARFFFANGIDDNNDGVIDDAFLADAAGSQAANLGEVYEPGLHGDGPGEFVDSEYNRDLNFTRFHNPGDLRVATIGCGSRNRAALEGGGGGGCHQETIEVVRRSIMVNQAAVTNGAYYGNESWRPDFFNARDKIAPANDPRAGGLGYQLDYNAADSCIDLSQTHDGSGGRGQPKFDSNCAETNAVADDPEVAAGASGNDNEPAFEIAQPKNGLFPPDGADGSDLDGNAIDPGIDSKDDPAHTISQLFGAGQSRYPWGGQTIVDPTAERAAFQPIANGEVLPGVPDPVDVILRTFRAYYPLNYPGSVINQNFTFGQSIEPDIDHFKTADPFGRAHSSGCTACHSIYNYDGSRNPTPVICNGDPDPQNLCQGVDTGSAVAVVDPTTKHREVFTQATDVPVTADANLDKITGQTLRGRAVKGQEQMVAGVAQQNAYGADHVMTTAITTDQCGLCHGFVTRINYAYQGEAEEEQRDQLSRRAPQIFSTPAGTQVQILDSWVRVEIVGGNGTVVQPGDGLAVVTKAKARDAALAAHGFLPGNGGCALNQFTEDCNNNGELDHMIKLQRLDESGNVLDTATLDEDGNVTFSDGTTAQAGNGNGKLDLIDRLPRENSIDGRQVRYVYGGRNGSTHQMDVHFEKGMHCIDCHFLQDVHGDGHIYSTNWDHIEIECEDCHGSTERSNLHTSGPNGGNDLRLAHDANLVPYFSDNGKQIIQRSRVTPGLFWIVPQTVDQTDALAQEAHIKQPHLSPPGQGSTFAGTPGQSKLNAATLECGTCHSEWLTNCTGCHVNVNIGDLQRLTIDANNNLTHSAHENEIWFSNSNNDGAGGGGHIDFQLLGQLRAPFVLGVSSSSESGRLGTFRSSMEAMASVTDANSNEVAENLSFTTFQAVDGNSGRTNVATSGVAMNQTMPHTVRPHEARGCEMCHTLVDNQGRSRNEHIMAETFGLGTGALEFAGDFGIAAGQTGVGGANGSPLELFEYKQDNELAANKTRANKANHSWFPGLIVNGADRNDANVEPIDASGSVGVDVALIRNFNATPAAPGMVQAPTLRDLLVTAVQGAGGNGTLLISDVSGKGTPGTRPAISDGTKEESVALDAQPRALAHIAPDVSDPFVYVAVGAQGIDVVEIDDAPSASATTATKVGHVTLASGNTASAIALAGDELYVGTDQGTVEAYDITDPKNPKPESSGPITVSTGAVNQLAVNGFALFGVSQTGLFALDLQAPDAPVAFTGAPGAEILPQIGARNLSVSQGHVYIALGANGVMDVDARTIAAPVVASADLLSGALVGFDAQDVVVSTMPGQVWLLVLGTNGSLGLQKLDNTKSTRDFCFPDPVKAGCTLDLKFMDLTQSGRDPSFDPIAKTFDAADPSSLSSIMPAKILTAGVRLARPAQWEAIGTLTGRRYRDSFMPGSGVLSLDVMQAMRSVLVCESTDTASRAPGNLNVLGYPDASHNCTELSPASVPMFKKPKQASRLACDPELPTVANGVRSMASSCKPVSKLKFDAPAAPGTQPAAPAQAAPGTAASAPVSAGGSRAAR